MLKLLLYVGASEFPWSAVNQGPQAMTNWNEYQDGAKVFHTPRFHYSLILMNAFQEAAVGKMLVDTAKTTGVKLLVWSALESFTELTNGRFPLAQFCDSKAEVTAYARASGVPLAIAMPGFGAFNIPIAHYALKRQEDGSYLFTLPISGATRVPLSDTAHDFGLYVQAAIESPVLGAGSEVRAGRIISLDEIVAQFAQGTQVMARRPFQTDLRPVLVSGKKIVYRQVDRESWIEGFAPPVKFLGPILGDMFQTFEAAGCEHFPSFAFDAGLTGSQFSVPNPRLMNISSRGNRGRGWRLWKQRRRSCCLRRKTLEKSEPAVLGPCNVSE